MPLHSGQVRYLEETQRRRTRKNVLVPANRWGKSTLIAAMHIHSNFYKLGIAPGNQSAWSKAEYRTANIAPHSSMTEPVFKTIHQILTSSFPIRTPDGRQVSNVCRIEWFYLRDRTLNTPPYKQFFANNSYIEHRSLGGDAGDSLQGKPYGLITYDEGGRSGHLEEEVGGNIMPRLFDWSGSFHLLSTPDQTSPSILFHYQMYQDGLAGLNDTYTQEGSLRENTFFAPEHLQEQFDLFENDPLGPQILEGKFVFGGNNIFESQSILDAKDDSLNDGIRYEEGHSYIVGTDTAIGSDEMVHTFLDVTSKPFRLVRMMAFKGNSKSPQMAMNDFVDLWDSYRHGDNIHQLLETWNGESARFYHDLPPHIQAKTRCYGAFQPEKMRTDNDNPIKIKTNPIKKADLLISTKKLLAAHEVKIPAHNEKLIQQLSIYRENDERIPTDRVISFCLACWLASDGTAKPTTVTFLDW